jgi:transposase
MTKGQAISEPIQWTIIRLSAAMPSHEISGFTDISDRKIRDIIAHFKKTGSIVVSKREKPTLHRSLQDEDIQVYLHLNLLITLTCAVKHLFKTLSSTPDLYLDELRLELQERLGVSVSISTIWRTLRRGGHTMKKVRYIGYQSLGS